MEGAWGIAQRFAGEVVGVARLEVRLEVRFNVEGALAGRDAVGEEE